jgi:hypothetical protein
MASSREDWERLAVTALGLGTAATLTAKIQTSWFTAAAGVNPAYLKLAIGYAAMKWGNRTPKVISKYVPDYGAGFLLDGARDLVVQYIVPQLSSWLSGIGGVATTPAAGTAEYAALVKTYADKGHRGHSGTVSMMGTSI